MEIIEKNKEINLEQNNILKEEQNNFLKSLLIKTINSGIDIGIKSIFPDFIDDQIINIKNNLINYGLKDGIQRTIEDTINLGKSAIGIVTGDFENIYQMQEAIKSGGIIDGISTLIDSVVNNARQSGLINSTISKSIKEGKNLILNNIENNIQKTFDDQTKAINYIEKYINNWKEFYNNKDFNGMEKEYNKLEKEINNIIPIEKIINQARVVENLHNLIKNNGKEFNLSETEIELAKKLI